MGVKIVIVFLICHITTVSAYTCNNTGYFYHFFNTLRTWNSSRDNCSATGGHLVNIERESENSFISSCSPNSESHWIGLYSWKCNGGVHEWTWTESQNAPPTWTNWDILYPKPDCDHVSGAIVFDTSTESFGKWRNFKNSSRPYICEFLDPCESNPCQNNGQCKPVFSNGKVMYECDCSDTGYTGENCEIEINECTDGSHECVNGDCENTKGSYVCLCYPGYTGRYCETDIEYCDSDPCLGGGTCQEKNSTFECECKLGYTGETCETDIDFCDPDPCNGRGTCLDLETGFECECNTGYTGEQCETDIDYCKSDPCLNNATCEEEQEGFFCKCKAGFTGVVCETDINFCDNVTCKNDGICLDNPESFECTCTEFYQGKYCQFDVNECRQDPDLCNNGTCYNYDGGFNCTCGEGYEGEFCEKYIEPDEDDNSELIWTLFYSGIGILVFEFIIIALLIVEYVLYHRNHNHDDSSREQDVGLEETTRNGIVEHGDGYASCSGE